MKLEHLFLKLFFPRTKGACISHFRKMLQLTQFDISTNLGINRTIISKMENGEIDVSENVWRYLLELIYKESDSIQGIPFKEFRKTLELCINDELSGGQVAWKEQRLY